MEFRVLGPLEVEVDGRPILLGGAKQRSLLALLLLARGRPVSRDALVESIWNGGPPETAAKSVQVYVSQLRKALGDGRVLTRERGYELVVAPRELDLDRFDAFVEEASVLPPEHAAGRLRAALALFRGEPLADLALEPWAAPEIARLEERRLAATEARIDVDLALGRHADLVGELESLVRLNPYREDLLARLVLALYRSGRQAEALDAHRRGAARLRTELGLEPGPRLRELEAEILRQDPVLEPPRDVAPRPTVRRRRWKLVLAGAAVVLLGLAATGAAVLGRGGTTGLESLPPGVAIVDTASGRLVAQIPWRELPFPAVGFTGDGSFWVWSLDGNTLARVDPRTGRVLRRIGSPLGAATTWALVDGRSVWFTGPRLVRMDVASGAQTDIHALSRDASDGLDEVARGAGSFWIARQQAGELLRVDPTSGRVQRRFRGLGAPYAVRFGDGAAWVVTFDGVARVDAETGTVTSTPLPPPVAELAVGGGFAWVSNEAKGVVYKLDPSGRMVATYPTGDGARDLAYADGMVWVANQDVGTVTGIDAATGAERTLHFGHPLQTVAAMSGKLLVSVNPGRTYEDRIDSLRGDVVRLFGPTFEFDHPDPAIGGNGKVHSFFFQAARATCAPLLAYPDAPPPRGERLVPELAAAPPSLSADGRTYTFTVRSGFRFAPPSNAPLDAEDVRFSIERALSPRLGPRALGARFLRDLQGVDAFRAGRAAHVDGIRVRGERISFTLTRPAPDFLERLSLPYFCPVPRDTPLTLDGVGVYTGPAPPGSGPYTFSGPVWNGEYALLRRNPNYGGSRPQRLDWIALREGIDVENGVGRLEGGGFDGTQQYDPLLAPGSAIARRFGRPNAPGGLSYRAFPARVTEYLAFDTRRPPFADRRVRAAVAAALDKHGLASFSRSRTPTDRLLPLGVRGAGEPGVASRPPARIRAYGTVRMAVQAGSDDARHQAELMQAAVAPLGLHVEPVPVADVDAAPAEEAAEEPSRRQTLGLGLLGLGALILVPLEELSNSYLGGQGAGLTFVVYGAIIVIIARFLPSGLLSLFERRPARPTAAKNQPASGHAD